MQNTNAKEPSTSKIFTLDFDLESDKHFVDDLMGILKTLKKDATISILDELKRQILGFTFSETRKIYQRLNNSSENLD